MAPSSGVRGAGVVVSDVGRITRVGACVVVLAISVAVMASAVGSPPGPERATAQAPAQGGALTVASTGDFDSIDPGRTYFTQGVMFTQAAHRTLVGSRPDQPGVLIPDLAETMPQVAPDGRSINVRIRAGVRFSPPVNREITSADVKYAIERGFFRSVATPYAPLYFADIVGARPNAAPGTAISGLETPDPRTLVVRLSRPSGAFVAAALSMPITSPVPREYAARFDAARESTYATHQVATGPYRVENDAQGNTVGYRPGRRLHLVRNPNWNAATDYRPARLDEISFELDNRDVRRAVERVLRGRSLVNADAPFSGPTLARELRRRRAQFVFTTNGVLQLLALNTRLAPFDDVDVRRAVVAGFDRAAELRAFGGPSSGVLATHFLPPGVPGFEEAGGRRGPRSPMYRRARGDRELAGRYLRRAGFAQGRYTGSRRLGLVTVNDELGREVADVAVRSLRRLGFRLRVRAVSADRANELCATPAARVHLCFQGWVRDFPDAQTVLEPLFAGKSIAPRANTNVSQLNDRVVNRDMAVARALIDPAARARAWARVDRDIVNRAPAVALSWPSFTAVRSANVAGQVSWLNGGVWDLSFCALR